MQTTPGLKQAAGKTTDLPRIRLLEAVGFRALPATTTCFDGTWAIRLTNGHPAKRLNCVNPLDRRDGLDIEARVSAVGKKFAEFSRPLCFRTTALVPELLLGWFSGNNWICAEESIVMTADLTGLDFSQICDQTPVCETDHWVEAYLALANAGSELKTGLANVIGSIESQTGLFLHRDEADKLVGAVRCVKHNQYCGIFELMIGEAFRGKGFGLVAMQTALKWALMTGAKTAYLQVTADNKPALALYRRLGFNEAYRYVYWFPPIRAPNLKQKSSSL